MTDTTKKFRLGRTSQCEKCPWRVDVDPTQIPNGYCESKHKALESTIAKEGDNPFSSSLHVMACHQSKIGHEQYCVGWLNHQLGVGNNIALRLKMSNCENIDQLSLIGDQHQSFEDTLPKNSDLRPITSTET